ncbi:hypothetical protein [Streptosporangium vulgare]|uniref:Uncharacterized protein n=1 Tax=Streptosporangium vulgare TaxID=46190 RepID=A0ABV5TQI9_9ACTN
MADLYPRTWPQRLADGAPFLGGAVLAVGEASRTDTLWISLLITGVGFGLIGFGLERIARYRRQRDTYRRALVALTQRCGEDQTRPYFVPYVPADVLAEVFPEEERRG